MKRIVLISLFIGSVIAFNVEFGGTEILTTTGEDQLLTTIDSIILGSEFDKFIDGIIDNIQREVNDVISEIRQELLDTLASVMNRVYLYAGLGFGMIVLTQLVINFVFYKKILRKLR